MPFLPNPNLICHRFLPITLSYQRNFNHSVRGYTAYLLEITTEYKDCQNQFSLEEHRKGIIWVSYLSSEKRPGEYSNLN